MTFEEIQWRLNNDRDFINLKRVGYSLAKLMERYPEGAPDKIIATALGVAEEDVEIIYQDAAARLRGLMKVEE